MKNKIIITFTLFFASTLLVAAEPLNKKTKPTEKSKATQLNEVKPAKKIFATENIVKPGKKRPRKPSEVQDELQILKEKYDAEKLAINDQYKYDLKKLKKRKKMELDELKKEYKKRRASLRKR